VSRKHLEKGGRMKQPKILTALLVCLSMTVLVTAAPAYSDNKNLTTTAAPYRIQSLNIPYPEFASSGDSVPVRVMGPTKKAVQTLSVRLNGSDVSKAFSLNGEPGSMTGTIPGLLPGANIIQVYPSKKSRQVLAKLTVSTAISPGRGCGDLISLTIPQGLLPSPADVVQIASATPTAATATLPEHCLVKGRINPRTGVNNTPFAIGFELRLPTQWSGRFFFQGGGGNDGAFPEATGDARFGARPALSRGFATVKTDGGHLGTTADTFGFDPQARVDHAYNAYGKTAGVSKAIIDLYYGKYPDKSYFIGCSGGGRQGMMFTQRFPDYFDGVVAAAPAMSVATKASISVAWESQAYNTIAPRDANGNQILSQAFSDADLALVSNAVLQACDALDGAGDGSINNTAKCTFDPAVLGCTGDKNASCLSPQQVAALKKGFSGPFNSAGQPLYTTWPWDTGIKDSGWRGWKLGTSPNATPNSRFFFLMQDAIRNEFFTPPESTFSILNFNFDKDPARMAAFGTIYDTWKDVELSAYRSRGGKLIIVHGMSDPIFSANESIDYYNRLVAARGGNVHAGSFARLFLVPGMTHCGGGPATDLFDVLADITNWVENGKAPDRITAKGNTYPGRTRPLCPYPMYARYTGKGSIEDADNFVCSHPERQNPRSRGVIN
jgi:pimeloyl-ACP methyl ester carboxylesterase